jgi:hypothetical protein
MPVCVCACALCLLPVCVQRAWSQAVLVAIGFLRSIIRAVNLSLKHCDSNHGKSDKDGDEEERGESERASKQHNKEDRERVAIM